MRRPAAGLVPALALALLPLFPATGGGAVPARPAAHDLHIAYGDMAIEGAVIAGRIRMFQDDLERALGPIVGADAFTLRPGEEADALVLRYIRDHLSLEVVGGDGRAASARAASDTRVLQPTLLQSGRDMLDRQPVWWVIVQYRATAPIDTLRVRNTLLFDVFGDQRNIMKFVRFPDERQKTFYFDDDETEHVVAL